MAHWNRWFSQLESSIYEGFSMAMLNKQMVYIYNIQIHIYIDCIVMRCFALPWLWVTLHIIYIHIHTCTYVIYVWREHDICHRSHSMSPPHILSRSKDHLQSSGTFARASSTTWARRTQRSDAVLTATMLVSCIWFSCILICTYIHIYKCPINI